MSLSDLQAASTKGKWWLVGAAWAGDPLAERQEANKSNPTAAAKEDAITNENALLKLARKQGMNTDIRRSVFVVIMSSDVRSFSSLLACVWVVLTLEIRITSMRVSGFRSSI